METELTLTPVKTLHHEEILLPEENKVLTSRSKPEILVKSPFIEANTESIGFSQFSRCCDFI
jgi:hypothetical protein